MTTFNQTAGAGTVPTPYVRGETPSRPDAYGVFLLQELQKIERSLRTVITLTPQAAAKAPANPVENMIRFAKAPWRPVSGQTTDRWVTYVAGAWVYLPNA